MEDKEIQQFFNIHRNTLGQWKNRDDWRGKVYLILKTITKDELESIMRSPIKHRASKVSELIGIPEETLSNWKDANDWRIKMLQFLKRLPEDFVNYPIAKDNWDFSYF